MLGKTFHNSLQAIYERGMRCVLTIQLHLWHPLLLNKKPDLGRPHLTM